MTAEAHTDHLGSARAALAEGRHAIAAEHAATAVATTPDASERQAALELAAELSLTLERPHEALAWSEQLRDETGSSMLAEVLHARAQLQLGEVEAALATIHAAAPDGSPDCVTALAEIRCQALLASGRLDEAATELDALLAADPSHAAAWQAAAVLCASGHLDVTPLVTELPDEALMRALGALVGAPSAGINCIAEALWQRWAGDARLLAFLAVVGGAFPVERALEWSARLRGHGTAEHCPLLAVAADDNRTGRERLRAAAITAATFSDERAEPLAEVAVGEVGDDELGAAVAEVAALSPDLVDAVIVAAASTPHRARQLALLAREHGDERGATALTRHAAELDSSPQR